jgi:mono/diheme cytochrome c family protein
MRAARAGRVLASGLLAALLAACDAWDRHLAAQAAVNSPGRILYLTYCESCHGVAGNGDGPAAGSLRTPPADLTRLWRRYGTPLDRQRLAEYIDGRLLVSFHGRREMPIWGDEFFADAPPGTPGLEATRRRLIEVLVEYLETLQTEQRS